MNDEMQGTLSTKEWDYVMQVLAQRPYAEVTNLITKLVSQFNSQRQPKPATLPEIPHE